MSKLIDLTGQQFGDWTVLHHISGSNWYCRCSCGKEKSVSGHSLKKGMSKSCGHNTSAFKDLSGQQFGDWTVLKFLGNQMWLCKCSCGIEKAVHGYSLTTGKSKSCGHNYNAFKDESGNKFGDWTVLSYAGNQKYNCRCSCGIEKLVDVRLLRNGESTSCGHNTTGFKDITNQTFGYLTPLEYLGNHIWKCKCKCGQYVDVHGYSLRSGNTKSCGCMQKELAFNSKIEKYGEVANKDYKRELWQIEVFKNKENFESYMIQFMMKYGRKPYISDMVELLGVNKSTVIQKAKLFGIENCLDTSGRSSKEENELLNFVKSIYDKEVAEHDRVVIKPKELDIYLPDIKLAFEYNGEYWHQLCEERHVGYHELKTRLCADKGVTLIHIWERDWLGNNEEVRSRIKYEISSRLSNIQKY